MQEMQVCPRICICCFRHRFWSFSRCTPQNGTQIHTEIFQMTSMTLIHLIGLPTSLLAQFSMVAFVPMIGALMIATVAADRVSES